MIITRAPLRISLVGGGTDIPKVYNYIGSGNTINIAINKYVYILVNKKYDGRVRVSYSKTEIVDSVNEVQHDIVRNAMRLVGIHSGIEVVSVADVPSGTGLGSSGAFTIALLKALHEFTHDHVETEQLIDEAAYIEIDHLGRYCGMQDAATATYGGIRHFHYSMNGLIEEELLRAYSFKHTWQNCLALYQYGNPRDAHNILKDYNIEEHKEELIAQAKLHHFSKAALQTNDLRLLGDCIQSSWKIKKSLSDKVSDTDLDNIIDEIMAEGAYGAKLLGAGGTGFILVAAPPNALDKISKLFTNRLYWEIDQWGVTVL